jgi:ABC-type glycerol-3-phosphate transport system substrate-binding protein
MPRFNKDDVLGKAHATQDYDGKLYALYRKETHPFLIVHIAREHVIVSASAFDCCGVGIPNTYDDMGSCLRLVPNDDITGILDEDETDTYVRCVGADQDMLDNAY